MFEEFKRWLNLEKGIFLGAATLLLAMGLVFQSTPLFDEWGLPRCDEPAPRFRPVSLEAPPALPGFLAGSRGSPFAVSDSTAAYARQPLPIVSPPPPPAEPVVVKPPKRPPPPPTTPKPKPKPRIPMQKPKPYDLPVRLAGRVKVGDSKNRTIFVVKEDGTYVSVQEGEELPGLGVRLVRATKNIVIVENEKGQRFRLDDLLNARAAELQSSQQGTQQGTQQGGKGKP